MCCCRDDSCGVAPATRLLSISAHRRAQAPGRLLTYADLNIGLVGRHAEMYWPDDNLWYLIKIQVGCVCPEQLATCCTCAWWHDYVSAWHAPAVKIAQ